MRAFIYCRVSSQRQVEEGHGLDGQEKRCRDFAKSLGYVVEKVFKDEGVSGGIIEREGMQALLNELEKYSNETDKSVVIIDDIKRFARDVQGHFILKTAIYSRNACLESPSHRFEDTPEGKFVETVLAGAAELERNQNKIQVKNRMKARLENGYWPFMPPLGLKNKKDPTHGKILTPYEPYASVFKKSIEKFRDGLLLTPQEVRQDLHKEFEMVGLPDRPALSSVQEILKNPLFAGYIEYPAWKVPFMKAKHEGFISFDTFNLVQERLQSRVKPWKRQDSRSDFPLRTFVTCDACNKILTASWNKGRSARYPNYFCRTKGCTYNWKTTSKYIIEPEFEILLSNSKPFDEYIDLMSDVVKEQWDIRFDRYTEFRERIRTEAEAINEEITSYLHRIPKIKDGELIAIYENEIIGLKRKKAQIENNLNRQKYTSEQFGTASDKVFKTLKKPMDMWKSDDYNDKRTIFFMYFEEKLRYNYEMGFGTASLAYPIKLINEIGQAKKASVEMSEESWNQIEEYIFRWYPVLLNSHETATM